MDLSGMIFVALAIGWAVYLLPKALRHHDEEDRRRSVEEFSDSVRVVGRGVVQTVRARAARVTETEVSVTVAEARSVPVERAETRAHSLVEPVETLDPRPSVVELAETPAIRPQTLTREAARNAARRRRRVLAGLVALLVVVLITSFLSITPTFTIAIPVLLIVAFLVAARLTVRAQQVRRVAPAQHEAASSAVQPSSVDEQSAVAGRSSVGEPVETLADLDGEDTQGLSRADLAEVVGEPVLDEGGLWDPLPVTLPTYVNKARARRTVRTIELTATTTGITSSGHDAADSELAREAELQADLQADLETDLQAAVEAEVDLMEAPKAAGA